METVTTAATTKKAGKVEWLAALRGLAALFVFLSHLRLNISADILFIFGRIGVTLFFLMSGYLTYTARVNRNAKQYIFNRFVRIYPIYWVILICAWSVAEIANRSIVNLLANMTLFELFLGQDILLYPSWMMPILVIFFTIIGIGGMAIIRHNRVPFMIFAFGVFSVLSGALRHFTGLPSPTAYPLLLMAAFLGLLFYSFHSGEISSKTLFAGIAVFECMLLFAAMLSYDNWWAYLVAYNIGLALFVGGHRVNLKITAFAKLGEIGFPFFLGSGIIGEVLRRLGIYEVQGFMAFTDCVIKFVLDLIFAYAVTRLVEKPVLRKAKEIEKKL